MNLENFTHVPRRYMVPVEELNGKPVLFACDQYDCSLVAVNCADWKEATAFLLATEACPEQHYDIIFIRRCRRCLEHERELNEALTLPPPTRDVVSPPPLPVSW